MDPVPGNRLERHGDADEARMSIPLFPCLRFGGTDWQCHDR
jgi:hypothetical protein